MNKARFRALGEACLNALAPCYCAVCDMPSGRSLALCRACQRELPFNRECCRCCGIPLPDSTFPCGRCQRRPPAFHTTIAPCLYTWPVSHLITAFKFRGQFSYLPVLGELLAQEVQRQLQSEPPPDCLVPMPLHWWRQWRRGFNQAEQLAQVLRRHPALRDYSLPLATGLVTRRKRTPPQLGLDAVTRQRNLRGAFACKKTLAAGAHVAIIDDVMTTGASAQALATVLRAAGAARVDLWCCARTPDP